MLTILFTIYSILQDSEPSLHFAHGGEADFRGKHNTYFNIFSSTGISLNMKTKDVVTLVPKPYLLKSSFFTEAHFCLLTQRTNKTIKVSMFANQSGYKTIIDEKINENTLGEWKDTQIDSVRILSKKITNLVRANGWEFNITRNIIEYPIEGQATKWRYNMRLTPIMNTEHLKLYGTPNINSVHGILGQSFDLHKLSYNGKKTVYNKIFIDQQEQAEGAIEGTWKDYIVNSEFDTNFKYSRYESTHNKIRKINFLNTSKAIKTIPIASINDDLGLEDYKRVIQ